MANKDMHDNEAGHDYYDNYDNGKGHDEYDMHANEAGHDYYDNYDNGTGLDEYDNYDNGRGHDEQDMHDNEAGKIIQFNFKSFVGSCHRRVVELDVTRKREEKIGKDTAYNHIPATGNDVTKSFNALKLCVYF